MWYVTRQASESADSNGRGGGAAAAQPRQSPPVPARPVRGLPDNFSRQSGHPATSSGTRRDTIPAPAPGMHFMCLLQICSGVWGGGRERETSGWRRGGRGGGFLGLKYGLSSLTRCRRVVLFHILSLGALAMLFFLLRLFSRDFFFLCPPFDNGLRLMWIYRSLRV